MLNKNNIHRIGRYLFAPDTLEYFCMREEDYRYTGVYKLYARRTAGYQNSVVNNNSNT